ncbi:MAG: lysylphosphatidylglycerol synthase domain-containing protein [Pyrinomonadaceae bacterium]
MNSPTEPQQLTTKHISRLKVAAIVLTVLGVGLFGYFIYSVGFWEILEGIERFGFAGFAVILSLFFVKICLRSFAWTLSVHEPSSLRMRDTIPAVLIGEAMSNTIPLGILVSGTSKAIAVRKRIPLVAGLSSVATENLFYSFTTGLLLIIGAAVFVYKFPVDDTVFITVGVIICVLAALIVLGMIMVIRQWHFASESCEWLYQHGIAKHLLESGRFKVRLFENLIYSFYRRYPGRFLPICSAEAVYHFIGIIEVWFILARLSEVSPPLLSAFLLESISRLITIVFKLIPFVMGVDEAGAQFVGSTLALAAGLGVTLAIIRKARILFWTFVGMLLILKRGLSIREISETEVAV